jgi:hypothetical protein
LDRSLLSIAIDNFLAFSRDQQTAADVAQMKGQMVAVDQTANIGIQFQGERPSGPAFIIWSIPRSARWQMRQAKPAMLIIGRSAQR